MDWKAEVIKLIEEYYTSVDVKYAPSTDVHRCIIDFLNLELKLIKPIPRTVFVSKELSSRNIPNENVQGLLAIGKKVKAGESVNFHQSRRAFEPSYNDPLLNDWLIHHLHLSDKKKRPEDKFFGRTRLVLFALFNSTQAFFIDVRAHGKYGEPNVFAKKELLEIVDNNWPSLIQQYLADDIFALSHNVTDAERDEFRKKGFSLGMTEVNGKFVRNPGVGITTSGHNMLIVSKANSIIRFVQESLQEIDKDEQGVKESLSKEVEYEIKELNVCIHRMEGWPYFRVFEKNSGYYIDKKYQ